MTIWTALFWRAALERAVKTLAQTLVALIGTQAVGVMDLDWGQMLSVAATATVLSVLTSIGSASFGNYGPSLANEAVVPPLHDTVVVEGE